MHRSAAGPDGARRVPEPADTPTGGPDAGEPDAEAGAAPPDRLSGGAPPDGFADGALPDRVYGDGVEWLVREPTQLPRGAGRGSLATLFVLDGQLPVVEAAPGNPLYDGGRWWVHVVAGDHPRVTGLGPDGDPRALLTHLDGLAVAATDTVFAGPLVRPPDG